MSSPTYVTFTKGNMPESYIEARQEPLSRVSTVITTVRDGLAEPSAEASPHPQIT